MKILHVLHQFLPKHVGGIELYVKNIAADQKRLGHEVLLFCGNGDVLWNPEVKELQLDGLQIICLQNKVAPATHLRPHFFLTFKNSDAEKLFSKVIIQFNPDVIHFHHTLYLSGDLIFLAKSNNIPAVLTLHDFWLICHKLHMVDWRGHQCRSPLRGAKCAFCLALEKQALYSCVKAFSYLLPLIYRTRYQLKVLQSADILILPSKFIQKILDRYVGLRKKAENIPYGIPVFCPSSRLDIPTHNIRFGYLGAIKRHKGLHLLIEAFNELIQEETILNIYGDMAVDPSYYDELIKNCRNDRVYFKGAYENQKVSEILNAIDVLIVPSVWRETGPMVILEALANQKPVIASNAGSMEELICNGKNGFLFEQGNPESLLKCIRIIIDNPSILSNLNCHLDERYNIENNSNALLNIYCQIAPTINPNS